MDTTADSVGTGIRRVKRTKAVKLPVHPDKTPLSELSDWTDVPEVANLIQEPNAYKLGKQEVMVLDLADKDDLAKYNEILSNSVSPKANLVVVEKDVKFVEDTANWKVLLTVQHVQFKKLFKKGLKPATVEAQEKLQSTI